jgi:CBS-domain-containing membrane protein
VSFSLKSVARRRQVFGGVLLAMAVAVLVVAWLGHVRRLSYLAFALAALGMWMVSRRGADGR